MHINYPMCAHQKNINSEINVIVWHVVRRLTFATEAYPTHHAHTHKFYKNIRLYLLMFNAHKVRQTCQFEMDKPDRRVPPFSVKVPHRQLPYTFTLNTIFYRLSPCKNAIDYHHGWHLSAHITFYILHTSYLYALLTKNFRMDHEFSILESCSVGRHSFFGNQPLNINRIIF